MITHHFASETTPVNIRTYGAVLLVGDLMTPQPQFVLEKSENIKTVLLDNIQGLDLN
jgi:hypothetical protein